MVQGLKACTFSQDCVRHINVFVSKPVHVCLSLTLDVSCHIKFTPIGRTSLVFILSDITRFAGFFAWLGTVSAQPLFRSHVKSVEESSLLQITVIKII